MRHCADDIMNKLPEQLVISQNIETSSFYLLVLDIEDLPMEHFNHLI